MAIRPVVIIEKLPSEEFLQRLDFSTVLEVGETISSVTATAVNRETGANATSVILGGAPIVSGAQTVDYELVGGVEGERYLLSVVATLNTTEKREQWIEIRLPVRTV